MKRTPEQAIDSLQREFPFSIRRKTGHAGEFGSAGETGRKFWEFFYIIDGVGELLTDTQRYPLLPGTLSLIHPQEAVTVDIRSSLLEYCTIQFQPESMAGSLCELQDDFDFFSILYHGGRHGERLHITGNDAEIRRIVRTMEQEYHRMPRNYRSRLKLLLLELLILLARKSCRPLRHPTAASVVEYIDHLIDTHFAEELRLDLMAARTGIAKSRLCRIYRAGTGQTIMDSLRIRRLNEAAEQLTATDRSISEICFASGFNDLSYFYRCFTGKFGSNPGTFRKKFHSP